MAEVRPLDEPQAEELIKDWELSWTGINFNHAKKAKKPPSSSWTWRKPNLQLATAAAVDPTQPKADFTQSVRNQEEGRERGKDSLHKGVHKSFLFRVGHKMYLFVSLWNI